MILITHYDDAHGDSRLQYYNYLQIEKRKEKLIENIFV